MSPAADAAPVAPLALLRVRQSKGEANMKVRCIDAGNSAFLKVGNVYSVLAERNGFWDLAGDNGWMFISFPPSRFEPIPDEPESPADWLVEGLREAANASPEVVERVKSHPSGYLPAAERTKVDPYEAHRLKHNDADVAAVMRLEDVTVDRWAPAEPTATARLLRSLEGEKVRERVRAFPHPARNPR